MDRAARALLAALAEALPRLAVEELSHGWFSYGSSEGVPGVELLEY